MIQTLRVLVVEDNPGDASLIQEMLPTAGPLIFQTKVVPRLSEALAELAATQFDIVVLDLGLPDSVGLDTVRAVRSSGRDSAIVVLTGRDDEPLGLAAIQHGAQDYLLKGQTSPLLLPRVLRHAHERHQAAQRLLASEQFLRATLDALSSNIAIIDASGKILEVNLAWREFAERNGASAPAVSEGVDYLKVCRDNEQGVLFAAGIQSVLSGQRGVFEMEYPCHSPDQRRWFRGKVTRFRAEGPPRAVIAHENITECTLAHEAVRESEQRYRTIISSVPGGLVHIFDRDFRYVFNAGEGMNRIGLTHEMLAGKSIHDVLAPDVAAAVDANYRRVLQGETVRFEGTHQSHHFLVSAAPLRNAVGEIENILVLSVDITDLKRAEEAVRASEARFRTIFDRVTDGVILADATTGRFALVNRAACEMLGYSESELLALSVHDIHPADTLPEVAQGFSRRAAGREPLASNIAIRRKDGTVFYADINAVPVTIDGRLLLMGNFRDVTERRALQASVAQADRLASMGMLAAGVAHEINNPLAYVLYNVESLAENLPKLAKEALRTRAALQELMTSSGVPDASAEHPHVSSHHFDDVLVSVRDALAGARRIQDISKGLGTFSRVETVELSEVSLKYAIECALNMVRNEIKYRARLVKDIGPLPPVWASDGKLSQVFLNLLINSAHAIEEGDEENNRISVRTWVEGDQVFTEITDTGKGIPAENLERIFEPFFTTKQAGVGSGLGLAICRNIVTGFAGDISVKSEVGKGTRVVVRLPAAGRVTRSQTEGHQSAEPKICAVRGRVLIIDDEEPICRILQRILGQEHEVVVSTSGVHARTLLESDRRFDVILCDLMMPHTSGMDLHEWLSAVYPGVADRMVFLTGGAFTPKGSKFLATVANPRVDKPMNVDALRVLVRAKIATAKSASAPSHRNGQEP